MVQQHADELRATERNVSSMTARTGQALSAVKEQRALSLAEA